MWPSVKPRRIRISENSLICAMLAPVKKLVLFLYPAIFMKLIIIIGLPIRINTEKIAACFIISGFGIVVSWLPKKTKKKTIKKYLSGFILLLNSLVYFVDARDIPAINAPISRENPR